MDLDPVFLVPAVLVTLLAVLVASALLTRTGDRVLWSSSPGGCSRTEPLQDQLKAAPEPEPEPVPELPAAPEYVPATLTVPEPAPEPAPEQAEKPEPLPEPPTAPEPVLLAAPELVSDPVAPEPAPETLTALEPVHVAEPEPAAGSKPGPGGEPGTLEWFIEPEPEPGIPQNDVAAADDKPETQEVLVAEQRWVRRVLISRTA